MAAALLVLLSAYAALLGLSPQDAPPAAGARTDALILSVILGAISCAGIAAAARPSDCIGLLTPKSLAESSPDHTHDPKGTPAFPLAAHHCSCGRFADHVLRIGDRTFCAGCVGMAAGGACGIGIAIALAAGFLFLGGTTALATTLLGTAAAATGLGQLYRQSSGGMHAAANLAFTAGAVLLAALLSTHGLAAGAFGLLAALALVGLRIEMSRWRHLSVYAECPWIQTCRGISALEAARRATRR